MRSDDAPGLYRAVRAFLRLCLAVFFRQVAVVGRDNVPDGPVIFAGNHPNSLIDPALIVAVARRPIHFAAKDVLFSKPWLKPFLTGLGAVPIRRRMDHGGKVDNAAAFEALTAVLGRGACMGIFPEGISHDLAQLQTLKTGALRIAFGAKREHPDMPLHVVPVGLTYVRPRAFRSRALVQFGEPIEIPVPAADEDAERAEVRELTDELETRLRALTINAEDWATIRVLDGVRRLYAPPDLPLGARVEITRRFCDAYAQLREEEDVREAYLRTAAYLDTLEACGLRDSDVRSKSSPVRLSFRILWHALLCAVWFPLALPGTIAFAPMILSLKLLGGVVAPRRDVIGTANLLLGTLGALAIVGTAATALGWTYGMVWGFALAGGLTLSGWAYLVLLARTGALTRVSGRVLKALVFGAQLEELRRERAELVGVIERLVEAHLPAGMERIVPAKPSPAG